MKEMETLIPNVRRDYLDFDDNECSQSFSLLSRFTPVELPNLVRISPSAEVISENDDNHNVLQSILAICDGKEGKQFIFLVHHNKKDGKKIYMGIRDKNDIPYKVRNQLNLLLKNNSCIETLLNESEQQDIMNLLGHMDYGICLTGIPSKKIQLSSTDNSYAYIIIAEPIDNKKIPDIIKECNKQIDDVHPVVRRNITNSRSQTEKNEKSRTQTKRDHSSRNQKIEAEAKYDDGVNMVRVKASISQSKTTETSQIKNDTKGISDTKGQQSEEEVINSNAKAAENYLQEFEKRFSSNKNKYWNVGVYYLSDESAWVKSEGPQLKSNINGNESMLEPVRWHKLDPFMEEDSVIETLLRLENPPLVAKDSIKHHFGDLFDNLTTPLTTSELSLLMNYK